jgi:uncharacterized protein YegL
MYVYLYRARGRSQNYYIRLSLYDCNDDGSPKDELKVVSLYAADVVRDDWYEFDFGITGATTPSNGYLAAVMRHSGDEDNFVLWAYDETNPDTDTIAWTSNNASDWVQYENSVMALRIVGNFDPFDSVNNSLTTPEAPAPITVTDPVVNGEIEYEKAILSFVVDSSGSNGMTDRCNNRKDVVECLINKFQDDYPSDVKFDMFTFGGADVDVGGFSGGLGTFATISLDLSVPTRTTFVFSVSGSTAEVDDVYENNGVNFTVQYKLKTNQTELVAFGDGSPIDSGTLTLVSGAGDATIDFSQINEVTVNDPMIAYGFKNFESGHTYNIGELKVDEASVSAVGLTNWQLMSPSSESPTITLGTNGPNDTDSVDILSTASAVSRKLFTTSEISESPMASILYVGEDTVTVEDASSFIVGGLIDIVQGDAANLGRTITAIDDETITFTPVATRSITNKDLAGSFVQTSTYNKTLTINGSTAKILVRDLAQTRNIIFYLQTQSGYYLEWDFKAFLDWVSFNIFFFGETALLPMSFFEKDGTPFPDGTQVDLSVDKEPDLITSNQAESTNVTTKSFAGQTKIYLASTEGYSRGQIIDIIDKEGNVQTTEIEEIDEDDGGLFIEIADPLLFDVSPESGTTIRPNQTTEEQITPTNDKLATEVPVVDITPIVNDKDVDSSLLKPYDIDRVPASTPYEDLNTAKEFIQKEVIDMPTVDGNVCARVLPIVEDVLETVAEKENDLSRLQRYSVQSDIVSQLEQNEGDAETATELPTVDEAATDSEEVDFVIETPVFTDNGIARSSMQSFSTEFDTRTFEEINIPGIGSPQFFSKDYEIFASADFLSEGGRTLARLYLEPFDISFVTPIVIDSTYVENDEVTYHLIDEDDEGCFPEYVPMAIRGIYASDEKSITLDYVIADKFILANNKTLRVNLYSNRVIDLDKVASSVVGSNALPTTEQFANIRPLRTLSTTDGSDNTITAIDQWRSIAQNNPFEEIINVANETDDTPAQGEGSGASISDDIITQYVDTLNAALPETEEAGPSGLFYTDPAQWTLAKQYAQYQFEIPIINGKASITIPNSDIVSLLMVEASVTFGDNNQNEQILNDMFFIANPVSIAGVSPNAFAPAENELYEIGTSIEFFGSTDDVADNIQVNYSFEDASFRVEPSSSVTDNGWAGGIFIGPFEPIPPEVPNPAKDIICPPTRDISAKIEVFHPSGYVRRATRLITLYGRTIEEEDGETFLFFASDATTPLYADGNVSEDAKVTVDLDDGINETLLWVGEDGVDRLQGLDQPNGLARPVRIINASPSKSTWENTSVDMFALPFNKNIGHKPPLAPGERFIEPWDKQVNAITSYLNADGVFSRGELASGRPFISGLGGIVIPKPINTYAEPLGITVSFETPFVRDGVASSTVVADVTWKGGPITNKFKLNEGTEFESEIDYPFPTVTFESGTCKMENSGEDGKAIDARNLGSGCLTVAPNTNAVLSDYSVKTGLFRTTVYDDGGNSHTHSVEIDENGDGTTTSTIIIDGSISSHTHTITNYVVDTQLGHTHTLRCVALTTMLPTSNIDTDFVVNGSVIYDPTNASPYGNEPVNPDGNRKMFATLRVSAGTELGKRLVSRIELGNDLDSGSPIFILDYPEAEDETGPVGSETTSATFYTATDIEETIKGFDIRVFVKFAEYTYVDDLGNEVVVPEEVVEDGSRVTIEMTPFKPVEESGTETTDPGFLVMGAGIQRDYMNLKTKVSVTSQGFISEREFTIRIVSILQWYPVIKHQLPELTSDDIYLNTAVDSFGYFGSSQIHDAVKKAAEQIVQYQTDDETFKDYKKFIVLITDGDENSSDNSLNQAISAVNFIDGEDQVQIIPIQLGQSHASDTVLLQKYAEEGNSSLFYLDDSDSSQISEVCNAITDGDNLQVSKTILTGSIVFEVPNIPSRTVLTGVTVPSGGEVSYRIRTSVDGISFSDFSDWTDYTVPFDHDISLESLQKYVEYEIRLIGNSNFESPVMNGGVNVDYYNPREFVIFFQPVPVNLNDDEYISSIHVTSEADIPDNSVVEFLMTQSDSLRPEEYYNIIPDQHTVIPTRFNEILETDDYRTYAAVNGRWNKNATIKLWRLLENESQGTEIPSSEYASNSAEGVVTFLSAQDPTSTIFMDVFFASSFRIATRVTNFADEAAVIHHIGVMYNVSKRIPRSGDGTIINVPISKRLP